MYCNQEIHIIILLFCGLCHCLVLETTTISSGEAHDTVISGFSVLGEDAENVKIESVQEGSNNITAIEENAQQANSSVPLEEEFLSENIFALGKQKEAVQNDLNTGERKELTLEDLSDDLLSWDPPQYIKTGFPMYISGFDYDDQPIWVCEMGKYDLYSVLRRGKSAQKEMETFIARMAKIGVSSVSWKNPRGYKFNAILDFDGLKMRQYAQFGSIAFLLRMLHNYRRLLEGHVDHVIIINANYPAHALINLWRPVIGRIMEVVDIYGNDKTKWIPHLLRLFPQESLPEWYGGFKNFTPYKVY